MSPEEESRVRKLEDGMMMLHNDISSLVVSAKESADSLKKTCCGTDTPNAARGTL